MFVVLVNYNNPGVISVFGHLYCRLYALNIYIFSIFIKILDKVSVTFFNSFFLF